MTELLTLTYLPYSHQGMLQQRGDSLDDSRTFRERMDSPERPWEGGGIPGKQWGSLVREEPVDSGEP